jgi:MGT family glycosyltransferase
MSNYLFTVPDGGGTTPPQLSVAAAMVARGHDVRVLCDPVLESEVDLIGARHVSWTRGPHRFVRSIETEPVSAWEAKTPLGAFARFRDEVMFGPAAAYAEDVLEELERESADAVVSDLVLVGAQIAAEVAGVPLVVMMTTIYPLPAPGLPPLGPGWKPAAGPLGRARDAAMNALQRRMWNGGLPALNAARRGHGLAPLDEALDQPLRADRTLVLTSRSFDFPADELPPGVRYVGPRLDDPGWVNGWTPPPGDDPLVLVGFTTAYQAHEDALRRTAAALSGMPVRAVLTTGPTVDPAEIDAGPNVQVLRSAPHREILEQAQLAITHGGHGTTIKALAAGVPVLCMPMGADQADVGARLVVSGAGIRIRPGSRPSAIARAATRILGEPGFSDAAQRMAAAIAADRRQDLAVMELESLLSSGSPTDGRPALKDAAPC